jgi:hypothetical protein
VGAGFERSLRYLFGCAAFSVLVYALLLALPIRTDPMSSLLRTV